MAEFFLTFSPDFPVSTATDAFELSGGFLPSLADDPPTQLTLSELLDLGLGCKFALDWFARNRATALNCFQ